MAAQGLHLGAQGLHLGAQGLYLAAQGLYIVHMGQMLHLARFGCAGGHPESQGPMFCTVNYRGWGPLTTTTCRHDIAESTSEAIFYMTSRRYRQSLETYRHVASKLFFAAWWPLKGPAAVGEEALRTRQWVMSAAVCIHRQGVSGHRGMLLKYNSLTPT